ncbi:MAG: hypothetical protein AUI14_17835 [Actinobacteria bacterium 13_2_20CM_2_71_6]|nr:MAG: hypothetical protein AUI14_17835 [Actinobacteria bacterium 13_2_20CM_2_71_6]
MTRTVSLPRLVVGYTAVAAALPYFALKLAWLSGAPIGVEPSLLHSPGLVPLNVLTAGMDLVAVLVALTFTHSFGLRVPAWLVALPMWVGSGLLAPIAVVAPFAALAALISGQTPVSADGPVRPWVYAMVYTGFVVEGLALITAFVLYARTRWPALFGTQVGDAPPGATHGLQKVFASGVAVLAAFVGTAHLAWALGSGWGLPARIVTGRTASTAALVDGSFGILAFAAVAGLLMIVRRWGARVPFWVPLALVWLGTGSMFGWGMWALVTTLSGSVLSAGPDMAVAQLIALGKVLAGVILATVAAFALAERSATIGACGHS